MSRIKDLVSQFAMLDLDEGPGPLKIFHPFPRLPVELRQKVWKEACFVPRLVPLARRLLDPGSSPTCTVVLESQRGVPSVLHTNRESRREARRYYTSVLRRDPSGSQIATVRHLLPPGVPVYLVPDWMDIYPYKSTSTLPMTETHDHLSAKRIYFVNFECDIFWHPHVDPLQDRSLFAVTYDFRSPGSGIRDARYAPAGEPALENYQFTNEILSRIQRLLLPVDYDPKVFTAIQKQYFLYTTRPSELKEVIFEVPAEEGQEITENVHGHLVFAEREKILTELVKSIKGPKIAEETKDTKAATLITSHSNDQKGLDKAVNALGGLAIAEKDTITTVDSSDLLSTSTGDKEKKLPRPFEKTRVTFRWIQRDTIELYPGSVGL